MRAFFFVLAAAGLIGAADPTPEPAEIPFALEHGNIVVQVEMQPGRSLPFVFDSGLSHGNIVTSDAAQALKLKSSGELNIGDASGDVHAATLTEVPSLRLGEATLSQQVFAVIDIPDAVTQRSGKPPLAGFLGAPLMKDAVLCLDYEAREMRRWARPAFKADGLTSVPMTLNHDLPTIVVLIDGEPATMIVDSGNNGAIVLYPSFAPESALRKRYPELSARSGSDGSGQPYQALSAEADVVEIAPGVGFHHVPLAIIPQGMDPAWGIDGMIGFEVLSRLNPCLDREGQRFLFAPE